MRAAYLVALAALCAGPSVLVVGCIFGGFDRVEDAPIVLADAGSDDADAPPPDVQVGCVSVTYPAPPSDARPGGTVDFLVAVRHVDFGDGEDGDSVGLNLDGECTCFEDAPPTCSSNAEHCDGPGGRDNGFRYLFEELALAGIDTLTAEQLSARAEDGEWTILVQVRDYNGDLDDEQVGVDWLIPTGILDPQWDGEDEWPVVSSSYDAVDPTLPLFTTNTAYVSGGFLVADLPDSTMVIAGSTYMELRLTSPYMVAVLEQIEDGNGNVRWNIPDATIGARWAMPDVFAAISSYREDGVAVVCTDSMFWGLGKGLLCDGADIHASLQGPTQPCDALSVGMYLRAYPARLGPVLDPTGPPGAPCAPENDPALATCD